MSTKTLGLSIALDTMAISQYQGIPFTGFFEIDGNIYGVCSSGIYLVGGDNDAGEDISWRVDGPMTDGGATEFKRGRCLSVEGETDNISASVAYETGDTPSIGTQQRGGIFYIGRDGGGRALQFSLSGSGPCEINRIRVDALLLGRRARG